MLVHDKQRMRCRFTQACWPLCTLASTPIQVNERKHMCEAGVRLCIVCGVIQSTRLCAVLLLYVLFADCWFDAATYNCEHT